MGATFGEQLIQFTRALDAVDPRNFKRIQELVEKYTRRTLNVSSTRLLVGAEVTGGDRQAVGLTPYSLVQEGDIRVIPVRHRRTGKFTSQAAVAFETQKPLWIVSSQLRNSLLRSADGFRDLWSSVPRLPPFRAVIHEPIRTSILIPLAYSNERVFGVASFETVERLDITPGAKMELENLAEAMSISYRLLRDSESRSRRTTEGLMALNDSLNEPLMKLTKPSIFLASSSRGEGDVIKVVRAVIKEAEFSEVFDEVYWKDMNRPGSINQQLLAKLSRCRYGVCYLSEETEGEKKRYTDNINVVFEAGMLHGRSDIASPVPASWIPIREESSPPTPFDFASQRMILVKRFKDGRLNVERLKTEFRKRLRGLIADDPSS